jgi:hypothetical protein
VKYDPIEILVQADMPTFTVMVNHSLLRLRKRIKVNSKPFLRNISRMLVYGGAL